MIFKTKNIDISVAQVCRSYKLNNTLLKNNKMVPCL